LVKRSWHSRSHSGHADFILVWYAKRHSLHSISTFGTSPYFSLISSTVRWLTALQPHWGQAVWIRYFFPDIEGSFLWLLLI
jgi:hypothetical protein